RMRKKSPQARAFFLPVWNSAGGLAFVALPVERLRRLEGFEADFGDLDGRHGGGFMTSASTHTTRGCLLRLDAHELDGAVGEGAVAPRAQAGDGLARGCAGRVHQVATAIVRDQFQLPADE